MAEETQNTEMGAGGGVGMAEIVKRLAGSDQRVSNLTEPEADAENAELIGVKNRQIRMEVENEYDRTVRELMKLNPAASENQIEDLASAIQANDAVNVDRVSKEIARTAQEAEAKEEREKNGTVDLQAGDSGDESAAGKMPTAQSREGWLKKTIGAMKWP